ncbi:MAG: NRDE family protein [Gammaproteobacteria bacterium]|nr:NRDE family protein [Gammaproteobacteria bacterium]
MCLILFALQQHQDYPLIVIANRDEYYARPTRSAHWWEDSAGIFAGRDLQAQGTWLGVNRNGRFAAVTNVREPESMAPGKLSRGNLPREFLAGDEPPESFLTRIKPDADAYAGFNLLIGDSNGLYFYSNRQTGVTPVPAGIYGISNGLFDEAWPKLTSGKQVLVSVLASAPTDSALMQILTDDSTAHEHQLPKTGVTIDIERMLSSRFIRSIDYGTRACSIVKFDNRNQIRFIEQNYTDSETDGELISENIQIE